MAEDEEKNKREPLSRKYTKEEKDYNDEIIKSIMYRTMKYPHPMTPLIDTVMSTKKESIEDVYSKFNFEKIDEMLDNLNKDDKKEDE